MRLKNLTYAKVFIKIVLLEKQPLINDFSQKKALTAIFVCAKLSHNFKTGGNFQFDKKIIDFIKDAVIEKILRDVKIEEMKNKRDGNCGTEFNIKDTDHKTPT